MMYIEGHWETVNTLSDISRIVREYYNYELADVLDELIPDSDNFEEELRELEDLRDIISEIRGLVI